MVTVYCPEELPLLDGLGNAHAHCPRVRAATKCVLVHAVMNHLTGLLEEDGMLGIKRKHSKQTFIQYFHMMTFNYWVCMDVRLIQER